MYHRPPIFQNQDRTKLRSFDLFHFCQVNHNQLFDGYGMGLLLTRPFTGYSPSLHVIKKVDNKKAKVQMLQVDLTDILLLYIGLMKFCKKRQLPFDRSDDDILAFCTNEKIGS